MSNLELLAVVMGMMAATPALCQVLPPVQLDTRLVVEDGCNINGGDSNPEALLSFGTVTNIRDVSSDIDGSTTVTHGGSSFTVTCNVSIGQVLATISGGEDDLDGVRRLANPAAPSQLIPYHIFLNEERTIELGIDTSVPLFDLGGEENTRISSQFSFDVYGRIFAPINVTAGAYTDLTNVRLTF